MCIDDIEWSSRSSRFLNLCVTSLDLGALFVLRGPLTAGCVEDHGGQGRRLHEWHETFPLPQTLTLPFPLPRAVRPSGVRSGLRLSSVCAAAAAGCAGGRLLVQELEAQPP